ncbi:MAG TPA: 2-isopropylmalate synthase [Candidatus Glassbacteria bacterium]|nr:2-isopropylmalate synthase [Candidatus Glassbacteria bacterium]
MSDDKRKIIIFDTTLRDGEQSPGCSMNLPEKLRMARQLDRLGVDVIEAGFPIASDGDFEAVEMVAREVRRPRIAGLARAVKIDIDRAWEALKQAERPRIHTFIATSDIHLQYKLKKSRQEVLDAAVAAVQLAKSYCGDVEFSCEDAGRTDDAYLAQVVKAAIEAGATTINIPDTVGYSVPSEWGARMKKLVQAVPELTTKAVLSVHCHNDLGLAVANSVAACQAGAGQVECTINGIGERAGNASLEEFVMICRTRHDLLDFTTDIVTEEIYPTSRLLSNTTGVFVQQNKAVVGKNAFAHEAGIHQDGMLKEKLTYEIMTPQSVGIQKSNIILGKHSGRHALDNRFKELGFILSREDLDKAYKLFSKLADQKKSITDEDLLAIVQDGIQRIPEKWHMKYLQTVGGNAIVGAATLVLTDMDSGEDVKDAAAGDGPVSALCNTIDRIVGLSGSMSDYQVHSITEGRDAVGEVFLRVIFDGVEYMGKAASTDVMDATARAYLNTVNKALFARLNAAKKAVGQKVV